MAQHSAIALNVLQGTGIVAIDNGYLIRDEAKAKGAKYQPGGVGQVIKPKSWVIVTPNEEEGRKGVKTLKKGARSPDFCAQGFEGCSAEGNIAMVSCTVCDGDLHRQCGTTIDDNGKECQLRRCSACASRKKGKRKAMS